MGNAKIIQHPLIKELFNHPSYEVLDDTFTITENGNKYVFSVELGLDNYYFGHGDTFCAVLRCNSKPLITFDEYSGYAVLQVKEIASAYTPQCLLHYLPMKCVLCECESFADNGFPVKYECCENAFCEDHKKKHYCKIMIYE